VQFRLSLVARGPPNSVTLGEVGHRDFRAGDQRGWRELGEGVESQAEPYKVNETTLDGVKSTAVTL